MDKRNICHGYIRERIYKRNICHGYIREISAMDIKEKYLPYL